MTTHTHRGLAAIAVAALLAACGTGGDPGDEPTTSVTPTGTTGPSPTATPVPSPTPTPEASVGPTADATPVGGAATGCDPDLSDLAAEAPNGAERVEEAIGDLDGDDVPDRLLTWRVTTGGGEAVHMLRVVTGSGFVAEAELTEAGSAARVRPLGSVPIGEGRHAALVVEDVGASAELVSLWGLHEWDDDPCSLGRLTIADDAAPVVFPVGATAGTADGLGCTDVEGVPTVEVRTATASADGSSWDWESRDLYWSGAGALRVVSTDSGTLATDELDRVTGIDCAGISLE